MCHADWLLQLGEGIIPNVVSTIHTDTIEFPSHSHANSKEDLIQHVYESLENNFNNVQ